MDYIKRKCACCGEYVVINSKDISGVIKFQNKFYHYECFEPLARTKSESKNKKTKATWTEALNNISILENETISALKESVSKEEFNLYLLDQYNVIEVPRRFWQIVNELTNGMYKGNRCRPVPISTVYDCWRWGQHKLDDINSFNKQNNKGPSDDNGRLSYDLAVVINKIPVYMKEKTKEDNVSKQIKRDIISSNTVSSKYINANKSASENNSNDISSLLDEIF